MESVYLAVALITVAMNAAIASADLVPAQFVLANAAEVHIPRTFLPVLAALKGLGAAGLLLGIVWSPALAIASSAGLTAFYLVATGAHVRASVLHNVAFPLTFLAFAGASLVLGLA